jgi:hypothetical protein
VRPTGRWSARTVRMGLRVRVQCSSCTRSASEEEEGRGVARSTKRTRPRSVSWKMGTVTWAPMHALGSIPTSAGSCRHVSRRTGRRHGNGVAAMACEAADMSAVR